MRILFTGASSFTGYWFVKELVAAGHSVVAPFRRGENDFEDVRAERVKEIHALCECRFGCAFGGDEFLSVIDATGPFDLFCHHAAVVGNYKSSAFDAIGALESNVHNLATVLKSLKRAGCRRMVLTGSVFEANEGTGTLPLHPFNLYGLSKTLTSSCVEYYAKCEGFSLGKFTISNPFGPFEEPRFTNYLIRTWFEGGLPKVMKPRHVRDNIHVSLLARAYVDFAQTLPGEPGFQRLNPSGYIESQAVFARRVAAEMAPRLDLRCDLEFAEQSEFSEPAVRINSDVLDRRVLRWNEGRAWDELADYYGRRRADSTGKQD